MTDPLFRTPGRVIPARLARPSERVWELRRDHVKWSCEFRFHGES